MKRVAALTLCLAACASAGGKTDVPEPRPAAKPETAMVGDFCWSRSPLLQEEKVCAAPEDQALAQDACARTALKALAHSHAANRDWYGMCMARYGLSRLPLPKE